MIGWFTDWRRRRAAYALRVAAQRDRLLNNHGLEHAEAAARRLAENSEDSFPRDVAKAVTREVRRLDGAKGADRWTGSTGRP